MPPGFLVQVESQVLPVVLKSFCDKGGNKALLLLRISKVLPTKLKNKRRASKMDEQAYHTPILHFEFACFGKPVLTRDSHYKSLTMI